MKRLRMDMLKTASILYGLWTKIFQQGARWTTISASGELTRLSSESIGSIQGARSWLPAAVREMSPRSYPEWLEYQSFTITYTDRFKVNCAPPPPPPLFYTLPRLCYVTVTCDWLGAYTLRFARTAVLFPSEIILKHYCFLIDTTMRFLNETVQCVIGFDDQPELYDVTV